MATYSKGKRAKKIKRSKIVTAILLLIIIISAIYLIVVSNWSIDDTPEENGIVENDTNTTENEDNNVNEEENNSISDIEIPEKVGKYEVTGQLVIDKIGVNKSIIKNYSMAAANVSVVKYRGPSINEPGNFVICGHNWENMLGSLHKLKKEDTFYMVDIETKTRVNYKVDRVYVCDPYDLSCLEQNTDGKREVTIITCIPGGAKRVICKARET